MAQPQPISRTEKFQAVKDFIGGCQLPPNALTMRTRDLNWTQALNVVLALANQQYFTLDESVFDQFTATRTTDGTITVTPPAEPAANAGNCDASNGRFAIRPATIRGVQFVYFDQWTREGDIQHSATQAWLTLLDPRFLVLLTWLCERLRSNWGATTLYHTGILGHGVTNCHRWGRAIDFAGVGGQVGWGSYVINVFKHWGKQPVTMPSDWGPINPATKKPKYQQGQELPQWPDQFEDTTYRLALPDDPDQFLAKVFKMPPLVDYASRVFQNVYDLAAVEAKDTDNPNDPPTTIGRDSRYIIHPDHHNTSLRTDHINHIHIQIGPTEHTGFWKN